MKRQQTQAKKNLHKKQDSQCKKNSQMAKMLANFKFSSRYKEVKKVDRIQKESRTRKVNFDTDDQVPRFYSRISISKDVINSRPYLCCCIYRSLVGLFNREKLSNI